ncbi:murein biosynthesis integral membrane protein MurJ [Caulobacter sp. D4A]|uniref:murein biosynthesis integral membrane protein MurJ n=1 Tax=unclassified Caulobacter TaxID=2648921 RepID=UPI000D72B4B8|nr:MULTISPECIES: murein biosynthesis integral membrane protein MurJ [unclassified Caulobacter]PXA92227.1 murein biosynthesis integral membrane protein MurJ [Caulobacter sp. D4A]PXA96631.1 murein biosynthesis integral membrane protein MurJ [Caulobacter sp. D5]
MTDTPAAAPEPTPAPAAKKGGGLFKSSAIYSGLTLVSRFMGFARDLAVSYRMGASATPAADAYNAALAFPNLFRRFFAEGAFAAAFVPAYAKSLQRDGEEKADILAADAMATLAASTIIITVICQLAMPWLMMLISPGFGWGTEKYKLAVLLTQITMPYLPCMAIVAHLSGVLNARDRFILSAGAPILLNIFTLAFILPQTTAVSAATWGSVGVVVAGVAQAALLTWGVNKSGAKVHWRLPRLTPEVRELIGKAIPGALAASATQVNIFISGALASHVPGGRTWLATADRLYQLPLGLVGVAIGVALLPRLSRAVHSGDREDAQGAMDQAVALAMALTLPAAAALAAMPGFLSDGLYTRGEFTAFDASQTAAALFFYGLGTPAFVLQQLYSRAFFARGDTKSPMRFALISVAVNIGLGLLLFQLMGVKGIAAATAVASWLNVGQMAFGLWRKKDYGPSLDTWSRLARILAASLGMALLLAAASHWRHLIEAPLRGIGLTGHAIGAKEFALALTCLAGAAVYPPLLFLFGGVKPSELKAVLRRGKA